MVTTGRLLNMGKNRAAMNMAIDETILITQKDHPNPTLRFYDWSNPAFSFGYFQNIASEVDIDECNTENIELVKRMTGGGIVVHGWDLTYSLILPRYSGEKTVSEMYQTIGKNLVNAFVKLGIPATCNSTIVNQSDSLQHICLTNLVENDVLLNGKKIAGVSARRNRNGVLFQGYISLDKPPDRILKQVSNKKEIYHEVRNNSTVINSDERNISRNTLINTISETYDIGISFNTGKLSEKELKLAEEVAHNKYGTDAWNYE